MEIWYIYLVRVTNRVVVDGRVCRATPLLAYRTQGCVLVCRTVVGNALLKIIVNVCDEEKQKNHKLIYYGTTIATS